MTPAHIVRDEAEAVETGKRWAAAHARASSASLITADLDAFSRIGLGSLNVPHALGGPGLSLATITRVLSIVATGNAPVARVAGRHLCTVDLLRSEPDDPGSRALQDLALRGLRFGHVGRNADDSPPIRLARSADGHVLTGRRSGDALDRSADLIPAHAIDDENQLVFAFADRTAAGLRFIDSDTNQQGIVSESDIILFEDVKVSADHVVMLRPTAARQHVQESAADAMNAAIDLGIIHRAVETEIATLRRRARPAPGKEDDERTEDPFAIRETAELKVRVHAADAVLARAAGIIDAAFLDESLAVNAVIALAEAKTLIAEAALRIDAEWFDGGVVLPSSRAAIRWASFAIGDYVVNGKAPVGQIRV